MTKWISGLILGAVFALCLALLLDGKSDSGLKTFAATAYLFFALPQAALIYFSRKSALQHEQEKQRVAQEQSAKQQAIATAEVKKPAPRARTRTNVDSPKKKVPKRVDVEDSDRKEAQGGSASSGRRTSAVELGVICTSLRYDEHEHGKHLAAILSKARAEWVKSKNDPTSPHYAKACKMLEKWFTVEYRVHMGFSMSLGLDDDNVINRVTEVGSVKDSSEAVDRAFADEPRLKSFEVVWLDFRNHTSDHPLREKDKLGFSPEIGTVAVYQVKPGRKLDSPQALQDFLVKAGELLTNCFSVKIKDEAIETVEVDEDGNEFRSVNSSYSGGDVELEVNLTAGNDFRSRLAQKVKESHKSQSLLGDEVAEPKRLLMLGDEQGLQQLLDGGLEVDTKVEGETLLKLAIMLAVTAGNWFDNEELSGTLQSTFSSVEDYGAALKRIALDLLDRGADVNASGGAMSVLALAEALNDSAILEICRARSNSVDDVNSTPLLLAAERGDVASLTTLLDRGARVNKRSLMTGVTPLIMASQGPDGEDAPPLAGEQLASQETAVQLLIERGAQIDAKSDNGDTAIGNAVRRGNTSIVRMLLEAGAKTTDALPKGEDLIALAKARGHADIVKLLHSRSGGSRQTLKNTAKRPEAGSTVPKTAANTKARANEAPAIAAFESAEAGVSKKANIGRFGLPFDVDAFLAHFPPGWTLVEKMDNETRTLLEGPNGGRIAVASHQLKPSSDLFEAVGEYAGYFDESEDIKAFTSSIGTQGWAVKVRDGDESNMMLELWGPALMSVRFIYESTPLDAATQAVLHKAVTNLVWLNGSVSCVDALPIKTIKDLQRHIRAVLRDRKGLRDEILSSFADDEDVMLYIHEIEAVAEQGPSTYPLVRALVRYAITHGVQVDVDDLCKLQAWCGAHFLNDPDLKQLLAGSAEGTAESTRDFLKLATAARASGDREREESLIQAALEAAKSTDDNITLASHPVIARDPARVHNLLDAALAVASDVGDLREVLNHDAAGADLLPLVLDRLRTSSADETFLSSAWNPLDVLIVACDKSFMNRAAVEAEILALADGSPILSDAPEQATVEALPASEEVDESNRLLALPDMAEIHGPSGDSMHLLSLAESARDEQWSSLREILLTRAIEAAATAGRKYSVYRFLRETLEDQPRADAYLEANQADLQPFLAKKRDAEQQEQLMDAICQCALLVAAGDGRVTPEETQEIQKVRPIVEMMYRNRHAIEILEQTEDIEKARSACGSTMLVHSLTSMWLFEPAYSREISGALSDVSTIEELDNLYRTYAARIEDPLGRRLAVWAATEVASADGFEESEQRALKIMAAVWGLNIQETQRWFRDFVYPVTSHSFEFTGRSVREG